MNFLGKNLRYLRKKSSLRQGDIGLLVNKGQTTIGNWEKGTVQPNIEEILFLSNYFGIPVDILLKNDLMEMSEAADGEPEEESEGPGERKAAAEGRGVGRKGKKRVGAGPAGKMAVAGGSGKMVDAGSVGKEVDTGRDGKKVGDGREKREEYAGSEGKEVGTDRGGKDIAPEGHVKKYDWDGQEESMAREKESLFYALNEIKSMREEIEHIKSRLGAAGEE